MRTAWLVLVFALTLAFVVTTGTVETSGVSSVAADRTIDIHVAPAPDAYLGVELETDRPEINTSALETEAENGSDTVVLRLSLENNAPGDRGLRVDVTTGDEHRRMYLRPTSRFEHDHKLRVSTTCDARLHVTAVGRDVYITFDWGVPCPDGSS
jgi:hypothetical protein